MPAEIVAFRPRVHLKTVGVPYWRRTEFERDIEAESFNARLPWDRKAKEWLDENVGEWSLAIRRSDDVVRTIKVGAMRGERVNFAQYVVEVELPDPEAACGFRAWIDSAACKNC